jgi:phospholipid/cholesterol/gamma-HCH transport system substrate-binding protein
VVGVFVMVMLAGLLVWIAVLSGRTGATDPYYIVYDNVMGLAPGTRVFFEGYPVGLVEEISAVQEDGQQWFRVDVAVRRGWRIPRDSVAGITASGLLSAIVIDIRAGAASALLEPGNAIQGAEAPNVFAIVSSAASDFAELAETLRPLLETLSKDTPRIVANLEVASVEINRALVRVNELLSTVNSERIDRILVDAESTSANFRSVSSEMGETKRSFDELLGQINALVQDNEANLEHALGDLHDLLESVLQHIGAISRNVEETSRNMNEFSRQIRRNPGVLIRGRSSEDEGSDSP